MPKTLHIPSCVFIYLSPVSLLILSNERLDEEAETGSTGLGGKRVSVAAGCFGQQSSEAAKGLSGWNHPTSTLQAQHTNHTHTGHTLTSPIGLELMLLVRLIRSLLYIKGCNIIYRC